MRTSRKEYGKIVKKRIQTHEQKTKLLLNNELRHDEHNAQLTENLFIFEGACSYVLLCIFIYAIIHAKNSILRSNVVA